MSEESPTPDLVELVRKQTEATNRRDMDALIASARPDVVYDTSPSGLGVYEVAVAIRRLFEDWRGAIEAPRFELEQALDLGNAVTFSVTRQDARPAGSSGYVRTREAHVTEWMEGMAARVTVYTDIDEGRAAAEQLAESRG
jgi:ketosteroid isomerase-like protein